MVDTALDNTPVNKNFLQTAHFRFTIKRAPHVNFFIQKINIPEITNRPVDTHNPLVKVPEAGDHMEFDPLVIVFKIDEDLENYLEISRWIRGLAFPDNTDEYKELASHKKYTGLGVKSDVSTHILTSAKNPRFEIVYKDAFPISLSGVEFDTTIEDAGHREAHAVFAYTSYDILPVV